LQSPKSKIRRFEPNLINNEEFYKVERILDHKLISRKIYFLIKWKDYYNDENSWESAANIDPKLIENYWD
jgi:5-bromo-4-chloroindolyl phosphate hydrolysis protein